MREKLPPRRFVFVLCALFAGFLTAHSQPETDKIKSIFILKFAENVVWPEKSSGYVIGVIGNPNMRKELEGRLAVKNQLNLVVKDISYNETADCDIVYLASGRDDMFAKVKDRTGSGMILLITESDFSSNGASISFKLVNNKMNFIVNRSTLDSKRLKVSNTLLTLGKQV